MKNLVIGLLWHDATSANLGVSALTHAHAHLLNEAAHDAKVMVTFVVIGWGADGSAHTTLPIERTCRVNARRLFGFSPELNKALKQCDLILDIGEGDSFSDIYGWKRLIYLLGTKFLAYRSRKPLVMSPQTIGPFRHWFTAWISDKMMARACAICPRDTLSTEYLLSRNLPIAPLEVVDVAFALPYTPSSASNKIRVGINVSGLLWAGGYSGDNQFGLRLDYRALMRALIEHFANLPEVEVVLIPHVVSQNRGAEDDLQVCEGLAHEFNGVMIAKPFISPMDAKSYISTCSFFFGARMHACIAAFSSGVPCIPLAYSRKFSGLFNTLNYPHVADCTRQSLADVVSQITVAFDNRSMLKAEVILGNEIARQRLGQYKQLLTKLLLECTNA